VVIGGSGGSPAVLDRRRIELIDSNMPGQPYHTAAAMELADAERFLAQYVRRAERLASKAMGAIVDELRGRGHAIVGCGLLLGSGRPLTTLSATLASHPMIHTAEGELFRDALKHAAAEHGLRVVGIKEREVHATAASTVGIAEGDLLAWLRGLGKEIGAPWRQDEKLATLAARLALAACTRR
jgi:hypothetical protein